MTILKKLIRFTFVKLVLTRKIAFFTINGTNSINYFSIVVTLFSTTTVQKKVIFPIYVHLRISYSQRSTFQCCRRLFNIVYIQNLENLPYNNHNVFLHPEGKIFVVKYSYSKHSRVSYFLFTTLIVSPS